jgi:hypothetical protein
MEMIPWYIVSNEVGSIPSRLDQVEQLEFNEMMFTLVRTASHIFKTHDAAYPFDTD